MSHLVKLSTAQRQAEGRPTFKHQGAFVAACQALGYGEPRWVVNQYMGQDRETQKAVHCTGWAVRFPRTDHGRAWEKPFVLGKPANQVAEGERFDINAEGVTEFFDNWPVYDYNHAEVIRSRELVEAYMTEHPGITAEQAREALAGERIIRVGEGGRWGDIEQLWALDDAYIKEANKAILAAVQEECALNNVALQELSCSEDRTELLLTFE